MKARSNLARIARALLVSSYALWGASIWLSIAFVFTFLVLGHAADDVQQIKLGSYDFYFPKSWMQGMVVVVYKQSSPMIYGPQPSPIEGDGLSIRPLDDWKPYGRKQLPELIRLGYSRFRNTPLPEQVVRDFPRNPDANTKAADNDGFVNISAQPGHLQMFKYAGYANKLGQSLIIESE
jgi:hypothetical protein